MGGAVSSLHRLRNQFLIRLYKKGLVDNTNTIRSLFESIGAGTEKDGIHSLTKAELKDIFGEDSIDILEELVLNCRFENDCIPVNFIVDFLEKGIFNPTTIETVKKQISSVNIYPEVWTVLGFKREDEYSTKMTVYSNENNKEQTNEDREESSKCNTIGHSMWKKHETVIQERIVKHTTIDKDGNINELITTDKSQNDVIHIESKVTGEFAHREYTQQEQTEELDKDLSSFVRATEEYIHLKSIEDEYEYLHSDVPTPTEENISSNDVDEEEHEESTERDYIADDDIL
jgi:hypothetical protein